MSVSSQEHKNNFGALRLFFASLVIVSHSPEMIDGNRSRELLTNIFGTMSFGELAIDGFFLISGYLILKSFQTSRSIKSFLIKRVLRIYPGFIAAFMFCMFIVAPLSAGWSVIDSQPVGFYIKIPFDLLTLTPPSVLGVAFNPHLKALNGSMWSIWLEFLCYLSIPTMFFLGLHHRKRYFYAIAITMFVYLFAKITGKNYWLPFPLKIDAYNSSRLLTAFLIGGAFYYYRDLVIWSQKLSVIFCSILVLLMYNKIAAEFVFFILGGYLLFNFALNYKHDWLNQVGSKNDISYGVYLYAWPIQCLIIQYIPKITPLELLLLTLPLSFAIGYLSWMVIEKPFMQLKKTLI